MKHCPAFLIAALIAVAAPCAHGSAEQYAGQWNRVSASTSVNITSWGENCGPEPKSYSNDNVVEVEIVAQGNHLVFTKGGLRTDRCSSANPRLSTKTEKIAGARWERVCETPPDDSKFERDEYTYIAVNANRIEYRVKSTYDWTLKGDHCVLSLEERRVFERAGSPHAEAPGGAAHKEEPAPIPEEGAEEAAPACEREGDLKRLQVFPKDAEIGPGERICFKASGIDAAGCKFDAAAVWIAQQAGVEVGGLMSRAGCFQAGATAADSEGSYDVIALAEGKKASASVRVVFPDLSDLLHVRLDPSRELGSSGTTSKAGDGTNPGTAPPPAASAPLAAPEPSSAPLLLILAVCLVIVVAAGVVVIVFVYRRKSAARARDDEDSDSMWLEQPRKVAADSAARQDDGSKVRCAKCGETFPAGSRFCPNDGTVLTPAGGVDRPSAIPPNAPGMVCPKCHRGYGSDARFCPHDSAKLVPYSEWRVGQRSGR